MKCKRCGKILRLSTEPCGEDKKGRTIFKEFGYCDDCKLKYEKKKGCGFGIAGMVVSILSILSLCAINEDFFLIVILLSLVGLVLSILSLARKESNKGFSISGIACSSVSIFLFIVLLIVKSYFPNGIVPKHNAEKAISNDNNEKKEDIRDEPDGSKNTNDKNGRYEFEKGVIWENSLVSISLDDWDKTNISFSIENKSDKDYEFYVYSISINGIMPNKNFFSVNKNVPSHKIGKMDVEFEKSWISEIGNIEYVDVIIMSTDSFFETDGIYTGIIRVETNYFDGDNIFDASDVLLEEGGIIVSKNDISDDKVSYCIINNNDYIIETNIENCSVNEWAFEPGFSNKIFDSGFSSSIDGNNIIVFPNSMACVDIDISWFMEENEIENLETFEFSLEILKGIPYVDSWETEKICIYR